MEPIKEGLDRLSEAIKNYESLSKKNELIKVNQAQKKLNRAREILYKKMDVLEQASLKFHQNSVEALAQKFSEVQNKKKVIL